MRNRALHDALRDFALEAAALLTRDLRGGAELAFELDQEPGGAAVLYHYRPLTGRFIAERWAAIRALPSCAAAAEALGSGAQAYLRLRGEPAVDAEPALRALLERLYDDATDFAFPEERFERIYAEVERTLYEEALAATVVAPLVGARIERPRVELGEGLALVAGDVAEAPAEAVWPRPAETGDTRPVPHVLCVLEDTVESAAELPIDEARARFRRLLSGLRLFKAGGVALGPLGWARADRGAWQPFELGPTGHARGAPWVLAAAEEDELRELLAVLADGRPIGPVAFARRRFDMGAERALETEALSDYLLGLRALLDGEGESGRASLTLRLAALCADERDRRSVQRRAEAALALERFLVAGEGDDAYVDEIGSETPRALVTEVEEHLRALLRDVLCGYLDPDLKGAADDILLKSGEPIEIRARDLRGSHRPPAEAGEAETGEIAAAVAAEGAGREAPVEEPDPVASAAEPDPKGAPADPERAARAPGRDRTPTVEHTPSTEWPQPAPGDAVTPSADWELDDEPSSYSAPV